jgi:hypothetical protein
MTTGLPNQKYSIALCVVSCLHSGTPLPIYLHLGEKI